MSENCPWCGEYYGTAGEAVHWCGQYWGYGWNTGTSIIAANPWEELSRLRAQLAEAQARGDTYRRRALVLVRRAATERSWYKFALVVADAQDAELAAAEAERDQARAALAEAQARGDTYRRRALALTGAALAEFSATVKKVRALPPGE